MEQNQIAKHILKMELKKLNINITNLTNFTNQIHENILVKFRNNELTDKELVNFITKLYFHTSKLESSVRMINIISN